MLHGPREGEGKGEGEKRREDGQAGASRRETRGLTETTGCFSSRATCVHKRQKREQAHREYLDRRRRDGQASLPPLSLLTALQRFVPRLSPVLPHESARPDLRAPCRRRTPTKSAEPLGVGTSGPPSGVAAREDAVAQGGSGGGQAYPGSDGRGLVTGVGLERKNTKTGVLLLGRCCWGVPRIGPVPRRKAKKLPR